MTPEKALFIPLKTEWFRAFEDGSKTVEYRLHGPRWNERTVYRGRPVTLSNGYSGARLSAVVVGHYVIEARDVPRATEIYHPWDELIAIELRLMRRKS